MADEQVKAALDAYMRLPTGVNSRTLAESMRNVVTLLADAIEKQAKEIEELERVNKNLREKINQHHDRYWEDRWRTEKANNQALEAENAKLREALKPIYWKPLPIELRAAPGDSDDN